MTLVRVAFASLYHGDLMLYDTNGQGLDLGPGDPFTFEHETCGTVLEHGSQ